MSNFWHYQNNIFYGGNTSLLEVAKTYGTPCYVYSQALIEERWQAYKTALNTHPHHLCYAVKANSNLAILQLLARLGAGFDIVSSGELHRVLLAGGQADKIVFSGVGKTAAEIAHALKIKIHCFNVESLPELDRIQQIAHAQQCQAPIALRINPNVNAQTHPYISTGLKENKFGISIEDALDVYRYAKQLPNIKIIGVDCHIGSQITQLDPFIAAIDSVLELVKKLADEQIHIEHIDMGGGLGISYQGEDPPAPGDLVQALLSRLTGHSLSLSLEPGRSIVGNAGVLLTQIEYIKQNSHKNFAIVDGGMNDLVRPALYDAWQSIVPLELHAHPNKMQYDIVGPVCESGDFFGKNRELTVMPGDYLAVQDAGAYGFVMSSQYNTRPRAAEVLLTAEGPKLIRQRETYEDLWKGEILL